MTPRKILVIDDEEDMRVLVSVFLEMEGEFEVIAVDSGAEGIRLATEQPPDAILLDYMMPGLDGPSTLAALKENASTRDVPVIFLSAKAELADCSAFAGMGAAGAIAKPFDPSTLARTLSGILNSVK